MESLNNLNTLANSLPNANLANAEKDLLNDFKAAALSITTLYRSGRTTSKRAYNAGYAQACQDLLQMIQQGVSDSESEAFGGSGLPTIGRVMDWVEARWEAVKAREEEEEEDEEKDRERRPSSAPVGGRDNQAPSSSKPIQSTPATPSALRQHQAHPPLQHRPSKSRLSTTTTTTSSSTQPKDPSPLNPAINPDPPSVSTTTPTSTPFDNVPLSQPTPTQTHEPFAFRPSNPPIPVPISEFTPSGVVGSIIPDTLNIAAGAKRRHAMMMMLDSAPTTTDLGAGAGTSSGSSVSGSGSGRRRSKRERGGGGAPLASIGHNANVGAGAGQGAGGIGMEAMDVEEDGRERKRVARR